MNLIKNQALAGKRDGVKLPAHEQVYLALRDQILFGELHPGQAVTIQGLTDSLGAGMTPVREAIRRLISDGALIFKGNRRVSVPELTVDEAEELIFIRKSIESELARRALLRIDKKLIARLVRIDAALDAAIGAGDVPGYLRQNHLFHSTLYRQAGAPVMEALTDRLWLRFGPSLRVVCGRFGTQNLPDRHKELLAALQAGDAEAVAAAVAQDIEQGMEIMAASLAGPARVPRFD